MKHVLIGMSGGVDSSLAAALLQQQDCRIAGAFCIMHRQSTDALEAAKQTAANLGIELYTIPLEEEFSRTVVEDFIDNYTQGRTPNPCVLCNPLVKFKALLDLANRKGFDFVATGHYAQIGQENGRYFIRKNPDKDQSYMLYRLTQEQLSRILFPLAGTYKQENRKLASTFAPETADKPDSQEICFLPAGTGYADFIEAKRGLFPPGEFWLEEESRCFGTHKGLIRYTVGQRKNLGLSAGVPLYVKKLDPNTNRVILSKNDVVDVRDAICINPVFQACSPEEKTIQGTVKIRHSKQETPAEVTIQKDRLLLHFQTPVRAITPGQSAVVYDKDKILCGGILE